MNTKSKNHYLLLTSRTALSCAALMLLGTTVALPQITEQMAVQATDPIESVFIATIVTIKKTLTSKLSKENLQKMNTESAKLYKGKSSRSFEKFSSNKIGWIVKSNGIELQCVTFNYDNNIPTSAEYLDALLPYSEAEKLHAQHINILSRSCKQSAPNKFLIGETYIATVKLFKGSTGKGRTVLFIEQSS